MTPGELKIRLLEDYGEASIETMIDAVRLIVEDDRTAYLGPRSEDSESVDENVLACIDATIEHLNAASCAIDASFK